MNQTMAKFGFPTSLVAEYSSWVVLARPQQVTLGSLVLIAKPDVTRLSDLQVDAYTELGSVIKDIEKNLLTCFNFDKINYLALMMVDPNVHFHVFPRFAVPRNFGGQSFCDHGWPGLPDLKTSTDVSPDLQSALTHYLRDGWIR